MEIKIEFAKKIIQAAIDFNVITEKSIAEEYLCDFIEGDFSLEELEEMIYGELSLKTACFNFSDSSSIWDSKYLNLNDLFGKSSVCPFRQTEDDIVKSAKIIDVKKYAEKFIVDPYAETIDSDAETIQNKEQKETAFEPQNNVDILQQADFGKRYKIEKEVARGGMAVIYLAQDKALMRTVAMKVHLPRQANDPNEDNFLPISLEQFIKEARLNGILAGNNVLPIYEVGVIPFGHEKFPNGGIYYTMRFLDSGTTLNAIKETEKKTYRTKMLRAFLKICMTVKLAHDKGFLHCDLKPSNIMFTSISEEVFVIDWGLSKLLGRKEDYTKYSYMYVKLEEGEREVGVASIGGLTIGGENAIVGTPQYMASEQARGEIDRFDESTDVYGLGGILYYIFKKRCPNIFNVKDDLGQILDDLGNKKFERDYSNMPEEIKIICKKCLEFEKKDRYSNISKLLDDLKKHGLIEKNYQKSMNCVFCKKDNIGGKFCTHCGKSILCNKCKIKIKKSDKKYCSECGTPFSYLKKLQNKFLKLNN